MRRHFRDFRTPPAERTLVHQGAPWEPHYELVNLLGSGGHPEPASAHQWRLQGDRETHQPRTDGGGADEFGHCFYAAGVTGSATELVAVDAWGDAFCFGFTHPRDGMDFRGPVDGFALRDFIGRKARRNGLSLVGGRDILLENGLLELNGDADGQQGVPMRAGIDLEPEHAQAPVNGVTIRRVDVIGNTDYGIVAAAPGGLSQVRNVLMEEVLVHHDSASGWALRLEFTGGRNIMRHSEVWGGCIRLCHMEFEDVDFYVAGHHPLAIDHYGDEPGTFRGCRINGEPLTAAGHPLFRWLGSGLTIQS